VKVTEREISPKILCMYSQSLKAVLYLFLDENAEIGIPDVSASVINSLDEIHVLSLFLYFVKSENKGKEGLSSGALISVILPTLFKD
jgi:hypothetical protein